VGNTRRENGKASGHSGKPGIKGEQSERPREHSTPGSIYPPIRTPNHPPGFLASWTFCGNDAAFGVILPNIENRDAVGNSPPLLRPFDYVIRIRDHECELNADQAVYRFSALDAIHYNYQDRSSASHANFKRKSLLCRTFERIYSILDIKYFSILFILIRMSTLL